MKIIAAGALGVGLGIAGLGAGLGVAALGACAARSPDVPLRPAALDASAPAADAAPVAVPPTRDAGDAALVPLALVPLVVAGAELPCGDAKCRAGEEVCCGRECVKVPRAIEGDVASAVAGVCAPGYTGRYPIHETVFSCESSAQCAQSSLCCAVTRPSTREGLSSPVYFRVNVCTDDPVRDCNDVELCSGPDCRAPRPRAIIPCGASVCSGQKPYCRYDTRGPLELAGQPRLPPVCASADDPPRIPLENELQCRSHPDGSPGLFLAVYT